MATGRPTKLTPEVQERIVRAISMGATYELAAQYGGISYDSFNEWMKKAEAGANGRFRQFFEAVKGAEGLAVVGWLEKIEKAANDGQWQPAAWKLERRYPRDYGRQLFEHTGKDGGAIEVKVDDARSDLAARIAAIAARRAAATDDQEPEPGDGGSAPL